MLIHVPFNLSVQSLILAFSLRYLLQFTPTVNACNFRQQESEKEEEKKNKNIYCQFTIILYPFSKFKEKKIFYINFLDINIIYFKVNHVLIFIP